MLLDQSVRSVNKKVIAFKVLSVLASGSLTVSQTKSPPDELIGQEGFFEEEKSLSNDADGHA
jgi:hypothetical protein